MLFYLSDYYCDYMLLRESTFWLFIIIVRFLSILCMHVSNVLKWKHSMNWHMHAPSFQFICWLITFLPSRITRTLKLMTNAFSIIFYYIWTVKKHTAKSNLTLGLFYMHGAKQQIHRGILNTLCQVHFDVRHLIASS